jgi:transcriptional activator SPT8
MQGHRGPVSALSIQHDERGFFSAGWDGQALVRYTCTMDHYDHVTNIFPCKQWDLDTGQISRRFVAHAAQLAALAVRPLSSDYPNVPLQFSQIKSGSNLSASADHGRQGKTSQPTAGDDLSSHPGAPTGRHIHVWASV